MNIRLLYLIKRAEIEATSRMLKELEPFDITPIQYAILYFLDYDKGNFSSAQLSRRFSMTPQSMNELVTVLERKKLLKKKADSTHKRILRLSLTATGKKKLSKCNSSLDKLEARLINSFNKNESIIIKELLGKIIEFSKTGDDA